MSGGDSPQVPHDLFTVERPRLVGLAYRMLGSVSDAEDVVQDVWLRWQAADRDGIDRAQAWLTTVTSRVALDLLRSKRRQESRETYIGPWLPEPILFDADPAKVSETADSLTLGFLVMLDSLSPMERVAFLLADVFAVPYRDIATAIGRSEAACRQIASRARRCVRSGSTRRPRADERKLVEDVLAALVAGDADAVIGLLAPDVVLVSDGGPSRRAARRPVIGAPRVARFMTNLAVRQIDRAIAEYVVVNGEPGLLVRIDGAVDSVIAFEVERDVVQGIWIMGNPDKLAHVEGDATIL